MATRPRTPTTTPTRRRLPAHQIPPGLQAAARLIESDVLETESIRERLMNADRRAVRMLANPLGSFAEEGANAELAQLACDLGAEQIATRIAAVIPESATHDPHRWLTEHAVAWQTAGLFLGLCLGWRIGADVEMRGGGR